MELILPENYDPGLPSGRHRTQSNTYVTRSRKRWDVKCT